MKPNGLIKVLLSYQLFPTSPRVEMDMTKVEGRGRSRAGLWGASDSFYCLFHARSFLTQLFVIGIVTIWGA